MNIFIFVLFLFLFPVVLVRSGAIITFVIVYSPGYDAAPMVLIFLRQTQFRCTSCMHVARLAMRSSLHNIILYLCTTARVQWLRTREQNAAFVCNTRTEYIRYRTFSEIDCNVWRLVFSLFYFFFLFFSSTLPYLS